MKNIIPQHIIIETAEYVQDATVEPRRGGVSPTITKKAAIQFVKDEVNNGFCDCKGCGCYDDDPEDCMYFTIREYINNLSDQDQLMLKLKGVK